MTKWQKWIKTKKVEALGLSFRSRWEANIARLLNWQVETKAIKSWSYEPRLFKFPDKQFKNRNSQRRPGFIIDFGVETLAGETVYYEVKGLWTGDADRKKSRMNEFYPDIIVIWIDEKEYHRVEEAYGDIVPGWEHSRRTGGAVEFD
jgi:hypothetical protein